MLTPRSLDAFSRDNGLDLCFFNLTIRKQNIRLFEANGPQSSKESKVCGCYS